MLHEAGGGLRLARQSRLAGTEAFEPYKNPYGRPCLGSFFQQPKGGAEPGSDIDAVTNGFIAVTPLQAHESADAVLEALLSTSFDDSMPHGA